MARLESTDQGPRETVDLAAVAREVLAELAPAAMARGQSLELDAEGPWRIRGSATLIGVLLRNLADNALRYSPAGARIDVSVQPVAGQVLLRVEDSGPGLPPEQAQRLGRRFERGLGHEESGSGLGWSIVRRIAQAQSAQVRVSRSPAASQRSWRPTSGRLPSALVAARAAARARSLLPVRAQSSLATSSRLALL